MADWIENDDVQEEPESLDDLGLGGKTVEEAADSEYLWRILVWSEPGLGKSHFAWTMPEPLAFLDTEGKADAIIHKFDLDSEKVRLWQPDDFDETESAMNEAFRFLDYWRDTEDEIGTLVVDSVSMLWHYAIYKHINHAYQGRDDIGPSDMSSGFGGGASDWVEIKRYHNQRLRQPMLESPYHICWTAMSEEDYNKKMELGLDVTPDKPAGEKENRYKVSDIVHLTQADSGETVGTLEKSGLLSYRYTGLTYPTFTDHRAITRSIEEQELDGVPPAEVETEYDATITRGLPRDDPDE